MATSIGCTGRQRHVVYHSCYSCYILIGRTSSFRLEAGKFFLSKLDKFNDDAEAFGTLHAATLVCVLAWANDIIRII